MLRAVHEGHDIAVAVIFNDVKSCIELLEAPDALHIEAQQAEEQAADGRPVGYHKDAVAVLVMRQDFPRLLQCPVPDLAERFAAPGRQGPVRRIDRFQFAWPLSRDFLIRMAFPDAEIGFLQFIVGDNIQMMRRSDTFGRHLGALERAAVDGIEMDMAKKFTQAPGLFQAVFIEGDVGRPLIPLLDIAFCFTMTC